MTVTRGGKANAKKAVAPIRLSNRTDAEFHTDNRNAVRNFVTQAKAANSDNARAFWTAKATAAFVGR